MDKILNLYKEIGETPLERMTKWRKLHPELEFTPMTYAGRLDPMAEGVLLVLYGEIVNEKTKYLSLIKEYEFEILFGFYTDTYDILGKVVSIYENENIKIEKNSIEKVFSNMIGKNEMPYPPFSSRPVFGKPLFVWAKEDRLDEISIPNHIVEIFSLKILGKIEIDKRELLKNIEDKINKVNGDFRQKEILSIWKSVVSKSNLKSFPIIKCIAGVGSGTYIRQIAHILGEKIGIPAVTYSIKRTQIGDYKVEDSER